MEAEIIEILASALQFLPEAVLLTETEAGLARVIFANQAFEHLTGFSIDELRGRDLTTLLGPETENLDALLHPSGTHEGSMLESVLYRKDGTPFRDRISQRDLRVGKRSYGVQIHSDVTQQSEIEKRFILAQKREATSHLVSGLAHDFNNLLTAILVYCGLMASKVKDDAQLQRYLDEVRGSAEQGAQLVAELMNLGREDVAEAEIVNLHELVEETTQLLKRVLGEDIRLSVEADPELHKVRVHPGRIQQVLLNLGINARDAMPRGGDLLIRLSNQELPPSAVPGPVAGSYVLLRVSDSGTGMDRETLANIFKPFFSTKGKDKGTGLGLFTAHTIVEQYHGTIDVESEVGKGTTFKILLPAAVAGSAGRATVLVVEDEERLRRSLDATLSLRGYKVLPVASGDQAVEVARSYPDEIALLLVDLGLRQNGISEAGKEIQKAHPKIKLLFMSEGSNDSRMLGGETKEFVKKPFSPPVLVQRIEEVLNRPSEP